MACPVNFRFLLLSYVWYRKVLSGFVRNMIKFFPYACRLAWSLRDFSIGRDKNFYDFIILGWSRLRSVTSSRCVPWNWPVEQVFLSIRLASFRHSYVFQWTTAVNSYPACFLDQHHIKTHRRSLTFPFAVPFFTSYLLFFPHIHTFTSLKIIYIYVCIYSVYFPVSLLRCIFIPSTLL